MSGRFKRFPYKSLKEVNETDNKNVDVFTSKDGSVTVVKKEEIRKNYKNNKLIKNDEDAKIIQDFCRKYLHFTKKSIKEENLEDNKKEQETQSTSNRGYFSKYRRNLNKQEENESQEKQNNINENSDKNNNNNQTEENKEESNSGRKYYRRRFFKKSENSNQNDSIEKDSSNQNKIKNKNNIEENNAPLRLKRKNYYSEEKKEKTDEEKKPKFFPTYHEKKKYIENDSQFDNKNYSNLKNYKCQIIEAIPVKFCNDYDYGYTSRMRFLSPVKTLYVQPFLNPNFIITKIKLDDDYLQKSNIGYASGINNNINYNRNNFSRNDYSYKNNDLFGREIFKSQYKTEYKYMNPFSNIDNSRNVGF